MLIAYQYAIEKRMHAQAEYAKHDVHEMVENLGRSQNLTQSFGKRTLIAHDTDNVYTFHNYL